MVLFFGIYVTYSALLSLTAFFARVHTIDLKLYPLDFLKAVGLCVLEVSCLRFALAWVRMTAHLSDTGRKSTTGAISSARRIQLK